MLVKCVFYQQGYLLCESFPVSLAPVFILSCSCWRPGPDPGYWANALTNQGSPNLAYAAEKEMTWVQLTFSLDVEVGVVQCALLEVELLYSSLIPIPHDLVPMPKHPIFWSHTPPTWVSCPGERAWDEVNIILRVWQKGRMCVCVCVSHMQCKWPAKTWPAGLVLPLLSCTPDCDPGFVQKYTWVTTPGYKHWD